jgi:transcriptional regulator with XRE-family HTH domain
MLTLSYLGEQIAARRKILGLSQAALAKKASVGRTTLDALENTRIGELGFSKISKILSALGMELKLQETLSRRPTLDELMLDELRNEDPDDQGLDRRG